MKKYRVCFLALLFFVLIAIIIVMFNIYAGYNKNVIEPTEEEIEKVRKNYIYSYQKKYLENKDYFPFRLNNQESIKYNTISYKKAIKSLLDYNYPVLEWNINGMDKILYDDKPYEIKNNILIKDEILYAEISDILEILDCDNFEFRLYKKDEKYCVIGAVFEKYDRKLEVEIVRYKNVEENYLCNNTMLMPGVIFDKDIIDLNKYPIINDGLIYIPLKDVLEYFKYDIKYDDKSRILEIQNNSNRAFLTWQEIYINAVNDAIATDLVDSVALKDVTGDGIPELFFECQYYYNFDINFRFGSNRGGNMFYCFWYNKKEKTLEVKADSIYRYQILGNKIVLYRKIVEGAKIFNETCVWNNEMEDFEYEEFDMTTEKYNSFKEFNRYSTHDIKNNKLNISDIINMYE